jgi:hypothetical protein
MERPIDGVRTSRFNIAPLSHMLVETCSVYLRCTTDYHNAKAKTSPRICECRQCADLGTSAESGDCGNLDRSALFWAVIRNCNGNGGSACGPMPWTEPQIVQQRG